MQPTTSPEPTRILLNTVQQACVRLNASRSTVYELISSGKLRCVHLGRAVRITEKSLVAFVERQD